jgi:pSer/pThr/pTyr-binding forkhead associated (FHA) protein
MPKMIVSIDGVVIKEVPLNKDRTTIGRRPYNDIVLDDLAVSGEHAVIHWAAQEASLEDLNSTNGSSINGKSVRKHLLANHDVVAIGTHKLRYVHEASTRVSTESNAQALAGTPQTVAALTQTPTQTQTPMPAGKAVVKVLSGAAAGHEVPLVKVVTTIGKSGVAVVAIIRRTQGFVVAHLEGSGSQSVSLNGQPIAAQPMEIKEGDLLELAGTKMRFSQGNEVPQPP